MTLTRTPAGDVTIPAIAKCIPAEATLAGGGGTLDYACQMSDLFAREAVEGDPSWKILDQLVKDGYVSTITFAADADDLNVVDEANEV
jgi:hypothetical protein